MFEGFGVIPMPQPQHSLEEQTAFKESALRTYNEKKIFKQDRTWFFNLKAGLKFMRNLHGGELLTASIIDVIHLWSEHNA